MDMLYFKKGSKFGFNGKILKVQMAKSDMECDGCFFRNYDDFDCRILACLKIDRKDKNSVIFVDATAE